MDIICMKCGYTNYVEQEEDTGRLYCVHCGYYVEGWEGG
jgi:DNA-directed RNA polymerase subunit RPC12/RpoP